MSCMYPENGPTHTYCYTWYRCCGLLSYVTTLTDRKWSVGEMITVLVGIMYSCVHGQFPFCGTGGTVILCLYPMMTQGIKRFDPDTNECIQRTTYNVVIF